MLKRIMQLCSFLVLTVPAVAVPQIERLDANGPDPKYADKLMLFGQFVGDWKFDMIVTWPDGTKVKGDGEWHFGWVLGGRAVQDVWIARDDVSKFGAQFSEWGSTMRFYDPKLDSWHVVWSGPMRGSLMTFVGKKIGDEIVMEVDSVQGLPRDIPETSSARRGQWVFDQITPNTFHWRSAVSSDGGKTWQINQEMFVRRVGSPTQRN